MAKAKKKESTLTLEEKLAQALVPESEQPYKVPKNWCWTRLSCVAKWGSGGTPSRKHPEFYNGDILWVKTGELNNNYIYNTEEKITEEAIVNSSAKLFPKDTIVIAMYGATIGKVAVLGVPATTNQACACGICSDGLYNKFLFYYAIQQKETFINLGKGGAQPNISQEIIKKHIIALPPLAEQRRIVERIEALFDKLDEAKEKLQEVLDSFETRKAAILHKAFTGELTAKWREEHGVSLDSWEKKKLGECTEKIGDGIHGTPVYTDNTNYYFVNGNNLSGTNIEIKADTKTVGYDEYKKYKVELDVDKTVFVSINGTLGKTAFYNEETIILGKSACFVNVLPCLDKNFLRYYFTSKEFIDYATAKATGSTIKNLGLKAMRELPLLVPSREEQIEINFLLENVLEKEETLKEKVLLVLDEFDLLKKTILARAFRGELGTNDENDECAVELLKKVL